MPDEHPQRRAKPSAKGTDNGVSLAGLADVPAMICANRCEQLGLDLTMQSGLDVRSHQLLCLLKRYAHLSAEQTIYEAIPAIASRNASISSSML
jgi:hypothetical protein